MPSVARARFEAALDRLVEAVREDSHVLAAVLCGSLSHDEVWDKSDIDLVLICTDDKKTATHGVALVEDDVNIHTTVMPRAAFRHRVEAATRNSFDHSLLAKGRLLFSTDPSIKQIFDELQSVGARDAGLQVMNSAQHALGALYKARKWHEIKDEPAYTAQWLAIAARSLAEVEVGLAGELVDREALRDALRLNPELFGPIYAHLFERRVTRKALGAALDAVDAYLESKAETLFAPILDYLDAAGGEPRSATDLGHHCRRNYDIHDVVLACEWLCDIGVIEKASVPVKLTVRSQTEVDELAFFRVA